MAKPVEMYLDTLSSGVRTISATTLTLNLEGIRLSHTKTEPPVITYSYCTKRRGTFLFRPDLSPLVQGTIYRLMCHHCDKGFLGLTEITDNTQRVTTGCLGILQTDPRVGEHVAVWHYDSKKRIYAAYHTDCWKILEVAPEI